jgi:hypothetical protein
MTTYTLRVICILLFGTLVSFQLLAGGYGKRQLPAATGKTEGVGYPCADETITVDHTTVHGVDHKAVVACNGHKIHWVKASDVDKFEIVFEDAPVGTTKNYGTGPGEKTSTDPYSAPSEINVYKYTVTLIIDKNGKKYGPFKDPHVVGGGGIPLLLDAK